MNTTNRSIRTGPGASRHQSVEPVSYQAIAGGLLSEMPQLMRSSETRKFSPPFKLVILNNQGVVVFSGEVGRNGKVRRSGPLCKVRRSHFPANAMVTDASFATRTFRIARPAHASTSR
jgi:hypothetical protein